MWENFKKYIIETFSILVYIAFFIVMSILLNNFTNYLSNTNTPLAETMCIILACEVFGDKLKNNNNE